MSKSKAHHAALAPCESIAQFVIGRLLEGLTVRVHVGEQSYDGYVHQLDFAKGADYVFAWVIVPLPGEERDSMDVKVAIGRNGDVTVLHQDEE